MNNTTPPWYWTNGLHDAQITSFDVVKLDYDYTLKNPIRNYLQLNLNSKNALFDTSIKAIRFYNFKCDNLNEFNKTYWLSDELNKVDGKFILKISLTKLNGEFPDVEIKFDDAEVIR